MAHTSAECRGEITTADEYNGQAEHNSDDDLVKKRIAENGVEKNLYSYHQKKSAFRDLFFLVNFISEVKLCPGTHTWQSNS